MNAELWIKRPCKHGYLRNHMLVTVPPYHLDKPCPGGLEERLDPEQMLYKVWARLGVDPPHGGTWRHVDIIVQDVLDALEEQ